MNQTVRNERVGSTMKRGKMWSKQKFSTFFRAFQFFFPLFLTTGRQKAFESPKKRNTMLSRIQIICRNVLYLIFSMVY